MEEIQNQHSDDDHRPFKPDEKALVPDQGTIPALAEFGNPIDRSDEDAESSQRERNEEDSELGAASQRRMLRIQRRVAHGSHPPYRLDCEIQT